MLNDINWLDGKNADGMYILEICYTDGTKAYMKNKEHEQIAYYISLLSDMPEVSNFLVYNPEGKQILGTRMAA
jgi:hypothetical protein